MSEVSKRVMVTGAATGIGAAIVQRCLRARHRVLAVDIDLDGLEALASKCPGIDAAVLDVSNERAWTEVVSEEEARGGPIDVLINNAGICSPGRCDEVSSRDDRLTVEVNLMGVIYGVRTLLPRFLERGSGHFINVASMAAFSPAPDLATYCATKHAVRAYTHSCALDHRHNDIEWTLACPSAVETPMLQRMRERRAGVVVFTENPMPPERFADEVVRAIKSPRREVLVPAGRGRLIRLFGLFPGLVARGMDGAEKRGRAALDRRPRDD